MKKVCHQPVHFLSAAASRQHPAKTNTGIPNADAVEEGAWHLGLCDGVSGVFQLGISPDEFPREFLGKCGQLLQPRLAELATRGKTAETAGRDASTWLTGLVEQAYDGTTVKGATTLILTALRESNLVTACIGDSGLLVLRPTNKRPLRLRTVFKTEPGRYDARRPLQVQRLPGFTEVNARQVIQGAMVSTTPVQPGDLLVLGSDGLFDNLSDTDIRMVLERVCTPQGFGPVEPRSIVDQLRKAAAALIDTAISRVRLNKHVDAEEQIPWQPLTGEVPANNADDTTAVVAIVMQDPNAVDMEVSDETEQAVPAERPKGEAPVVRGQVVACAPRSTNSTAGVQSAPSAPPPIMASNGSRLEWPAGLEPFRPPDRHPSRHGAPVRYVGGREPCTIRYRQQEACKRPEDCIIS